MTRSDTYCTSLRNKCILQHPGAHTTEENIPGLACTACGGTGGTGGMAGGAADGGGGDGGGAAPTASAAGGGEALAAATSEETEVKTGKCSMDLMISKNIHFAFLVMFFFFKTFYIHSRFNNICNS